jgi:hypothetical protein
MRRNSFPAILLSVLAILACGAIGAFAGLGVVRWIGLSGVPSALVATLVGMIVATAAFAVGVALLRRFTSFR